MFLLQKVSQEVEDGAPVTSVELIQDSPGDKDKGGNSRHDKTPSASPLKERSRSRDPSRSASVRSREDGDGTNVMEDSIEGLGAKVC